MSNDSPNNLRLVAKCAEDASYTSPRFKSSLHFWMVAAGVLSVNTIGSPIVSPFSDGTTITKLPPNMSGKILASFM